MTTKIDSLLVNPIKESKKIKIAPSLLSADFANLKDELELIEKAGADYLHIDVMDYNFVPNLTFGAPLIKALRKHSSLFFDVHLMVKNPSLLVDDMVNAGANLISFHIEAEPHANRLAKYIKSKGVKVGVALNPASSPSTIKYLLPYVDLVLIMTVNPGFGGQEFIENQLEKIAYIKTMIKEQNLSIDIEVDGGINEKYAKLTKQQGANILVAGSYIFADKNYKEKIKLLKNV